MKRIERPPLVLYVERDRLGSLLCLWMFCLLLPVIRAAWKAPLLNTLVCSLAVFAGLFAFVLLFRARVLAVDRDAGEVRILVRAVPWRTVRTRIPLERALVWMNERRESSGTRYEACVAESGGRPWLVRSSSSREDTARLARQLAADMGRPLWEPPVAAPEPRG
ncbi:MAG TPA: hypothetical protein VF950_13910 [Planctomycetota bacterium]